MAENYFRLPQEIFEIILSFLKVNDVLSCSLVCIEWRNAVNSNEIWEKLFAYHFPRKRVSMCGAKRLPPAYDESQISELCFWRRQFTEETELMNNWRKGRCGEEVVSEIIVGLHDLETDYDLLVEPSMAESFFTVYDIVDTPIKTNTYDFALEQPIPEFFKFTNDVLVIVQCTVLQVFSKGEKRELTPSFRALFDRNNSHDIPDVFNLTDWYSQHVGLYPCDIYVRCDHNGKYFVGFYDTSTHFRSSLVHIWDVTSGKKIQAIPLPTIPVTTTVLDVNFSLRRNIIHFIIKVMEPGARLPVDIIYSYDIDKLCYNEKTLRAGFVVPTIFFTDSLAVLSNRPGRKIIIYDLKHPDQILESIDVRPSTVNHRNVQVIGNILIFSTFSPRNSEEDYIYAYDVSKFQLTAVFSLPRVKISNIHVIMDNLMIVNATWHLVIWNLVRNEKVCQLNYIDFLAPGPSCSKMITQNSEGQIVVLNFW